MKQLAWYLNVRLTGCPVSNLVVVSFQLVVVDQLEKIDSPSAIECNSRIVLRCRLAQQDNESFVVDNALCQVLAQLSNHL